MGQSRAVPHQHRSGFRMGAIVSLLIIMLGGCGSAPAAVPWAEQLQAAQRAAQAQDSNAVLSVVSTTSIFTEKSLVPATVPVLITFNTSPGTDVTLRYESGNPAGTMKPFSTSMGEVPPAIPDATIAAIQHSPADVLQTTWDAGRRYQNQFPAEPALQAVRVDLVTNPALMPSTVQAPGVWQVTYEVYTDTGLQQTAIFWVDITTGVILAQEQSSH